MKKFSNQLSYGSVLLIFILLLAAGLFIHHNLPAGTEMDRKIILAMEKIKEEMRDSGEHGDIIIDEKMIDIPVLDVESTGLEEEIIPENAAPEVVAPAEKEGSAVGVEKVLVVKEEPVAALTSSTPEPEEISLKDQLEQRISLNVIKEDIDTVLRSIARAYDFNVIIASEIREIKVTADLKNVKIIDIFNTLLVDQGLGYRISGDIIRVTTLEQLQEEDAKAEVALKTRKDKEASEPLEVKTFELRYIDANDAKEAIKPMLTPKRGNAMVLQTKQYTGFEFEATESFAQNEAEKAATEFVRSRILIVQDIQTVLDQIDKVIKKIDQRPPQIMIDAKILEVPIDQEFRLGINWTQALDQWQVGASDLSATFDRSFSRTNEGITGDSRSWGENNSITNKISDSGDTEYNYTNDVSSSQGRDSGGAYQDNDSTVSNVYSILQNQGYDNTESQEIFDDYINNVSNTLTNLTTSGQAYSAILGAADFSLMLSAMETDSNIVVLSNPRIVVHENYAAKIFIGHRYPIIEFEQPETSSGDSGGGLQAPTLTVGEWKEIGITLKVIPQVRETLTGGSSINMIIHPAVSSSEGEFVDVKDPFSGFESEYPIISIREADTNVTINDGDTIVIGGLISSYTVDEEDKIPLLGDIPILGYLFKEEHTVLKKTNLLIFITAKIVREDIELSNYEKIMLEKMPPDALEDIQYIEDNKLRPYLYKSSEDLESLKSGEGAEEDSGDDNDGEESEEEEDEDNEGNFEGRKITKAYKRSRMR